MGRCPAAMRNHGRVMDPSALVAADVANAVGALVGIAVAGALWLVFAFRSLKLRDEGSPLYVGLIRWTGEQVRTRQRAVAFVLAWGLIMFVLNVLIG